MNVHLYITTTVRDCPYLHVKSIQLGYTTEKRETTFIHTHVACDRFVDEPNTSILLSRLLVKPPFLPPEYTQADPNRQHPKDC
jgi:hypothetical protein